MISRRTRARAVTLASPRNSIVISLRTQFKRWGTPFRASARGQAGSRCDGSPRRRRSNRATRRRQRSRRQRRLAGLDRPVEHRANRVGDLRRVARPLRRLRHQQRSALQAPRLHPRPAPTRRRRATRRVVPHLPAHGLHRQPRPPQAAPPRSSATTGAAASSRCAATATPRISTCPSDPARRPSASRPCQPPRPHSRHPTHRRRQCPRRSAQAAKPHTQPREPASRPEGEPWAATRRSDGGTALRRTRPPTPERRRPPGGWPSSRTALRRQPLKRIPHRGQHSGGGIRTRDLRVMSPTSYLAAPPRDARHAV